MSIMPCSLCDFKTQPPQGAVAIVKHAETSQTFERTRGVHWVPTRTQVEVKVGSKKWNAQPVLQESNYVVLHQNHVYTVDEWYALSPIVTFAPEMKPFIPDGVPSSSYQEVQHGDNDDDDVDVVDDENDDVEEDVTEDPIEIACREYIYQHPTCTTLVPLIELLAHIPGSQKRIQEIIKVRKGYYVLYDQKDEEELEDPVRAFFRDFTKGRKIPHLKPLWEAIRTKFPEMTKSEFAQYTQRFILKDDDGYIMKP